MLLLGVVLLAQSAGMVGNVGFRSVDIPTADLATLDAALDRAIVVNAASARGRTTTLSALAADPEVAGRRAEARRAADAGAAAMRSLDAEKAQSEFDRAVTLFVASHGDRLDTGDLSRVYTTRAKVAQLRQNKVLMREEFGRAVPHHPTKQLDPASFPPDSVKLFEDVAAAARQAPLAAPAHLPLADIAKRTGLAYIVAGEARRDLSVPNAFKLAITVVDAAGASQSTTVDAAEPDLVGSLERAIAKLFQQAGVPGSMAATLAAQATPVPTAIPTAVAVATPRPVPTQALPKARAKPKPRNPDAQRRWYYVIGGVLAVGAIAAVAGTQSGGGGGGGGGGGNDGITLTLERP